MQILLLRHYSLVEGPSMRSFADQIVDGLRSRGYVVQELTAPVLFGRLIPFSHSVAKWLGYIDQFLIFPPLLWLKARRLPCGSLCVLVDQALGPWLPWLAGRPYVVHCHDLLALQASFSRQPFHHLGLSGCFYQRLIWKGFRKGKYFLSVSAATQAALHPYLSRPPLYSAVLYNPLHPRFSSASPPDAMALLLQKALPHLSYQNFIFHIGRNWYKNRGGVLAIWEQLHLLGFPLHLVLVGSLDASLQSWLDQRPQLSPRVHVLDRASDELVVALYNFAALLLFPSHAEGFGWPVLEALSCGCPVITTDRPPMTEVGGDAITTIPPAPPPPASLTVWAEAAAQQVMQVLTRRNAERERVRQLGFAQAHCFQLEPWLNQLENHYQQILGLQEN